MNPRAWIESQQKQFLPCLNTRFMKVGNKKVPSLFYCIIPKEKDLKNLLSADDASSAFRKFSYKEMTNATNDFNTVIGQGGFGTVYKAEFSDGLVAAVKKMTKVSEQAEQDFCREIELLAKLHHRNLVALKGFCINKKER